MLEKQKPPQSLGSCRFLAIKRALHAGVFSIFIVIQPVSAKEFQIFFRLMYVAKKLQKAQAEGEENMSCGSAMVVHCYIPSFQLSASFSLRNRDVSVAHQLMDDAA